MRGRRVSLLAEREGDSSFSVDAYLDEAGNLKIDGQDLGPATAPWSSDGEYEWIATVPAPSLVQAIEALGGTSGDPILELLVREYSGRKAYAIRATLEAAGIPVELWTWSG